jgi:hypothetical protein
MPPQTLTPERQGDGIRQRARREGCHLLVLAAPACRVTSTLPVRIQRCPATSLRRLRDVWVTLGQSARLAPFIRSRSPGQAVTSANDRLATLWSYSRLFTLSLMGAP